MAMPTIQPSNDDLYDLDLSFLDDLPEVTSAETDHILQEPTPVLDVDQTDFEVASWAHRLDQQVGAEPDYTNFASWIPEFERPLKPCDYCRSKRLDCYLRKGQTHCYPCMNLFRDCSLNSTTMEATNYASNSQGTFFDALHSVGEDTCIEQGSRATIRYLKSKHGELITAQSDDASANNRRNGIRFPQAAVKALREWYQSHQDHPYPTEEEKASLEETTGLRPHQIANWLANQRRKSKVIAKARPRRCVSPSAQRPGTPAIDILENDKPWEELNPLERWQHSPPENEPAAFENIANAVASSDLHDDASPLSSYGVIRHKSSNESALSGRRAASTTSAETSQCSSLSAPSSAAHSNGSSHGSFGSFSSSLAGKKDRRRRKRAMPLRQTTNDRQRPFQCTFCTDTFRSKYDWTRHEKSLHVSLEKYICAPIGPYIIGNSTSQKVCVYCGAQDPEKGHEETHNHSACEEKGLDSRTFYRKDHLRQHLRLMHGCELSPSMDAWKFTTTDINSRCGFCAQRFSSWQDRVDHLTGHFRAGTRMIDWKGCRGLDPAIAAIVTNAMPPYLIGIESMSLNPFSATNEASMREFDDPLDEVACEHSRSSPKPRSPDDLPPKATCWEILTISLGKYANEMISKGIVLTDEMLQSQARHILYGSDDTWNQTAADNPEWLDLFKKGHGLDLIPSQVGGQGQKVPEDLEWYSDLGVRIPFFVQLEQFNKTQNEEALKSGKGGRLRKEAETSVMMRNVYEQLSSEGLLHSSSVVCPHSACAKNIVECHLVDEDRQLRRRQNRWCNEAVAPSNAGSLAKFIGLARSGVPIAPLKENAASTALRAAKSRAQCLENLQWGEVECCPFRKQIDILGERRDNMNARLATLEKATMADSQHPQNVLEQAANGSVYLPYHRHTLPVDRAKHYASVTGPWEDSGRMPESLSTGNEHSLTRNNILDDLRTDWHGQIDVSNDATSMPLQLALQFTTTMHDGTLLENNWDMLDSLPTTTSLKELDITPGMDGQYNVDQTAADHAVRYNEMTNDGVFDMSIE